MLGWKLFKHSLGLVLRNFNAVLRIFLFPSLCIAGLAVLLLGRDLLLLVQLDPEAMAGETVASGGFALRLVVVYLASIVTTLWLAVSWHRYILLAEVPEGYLPGFHGEQVWAYFRVALLIFAIYLGGAILFFLALILSMSLSGGMPAVTIALSVLLILALVVLMLWVARLTPMLPGAAIGHPVTMKQALAATRAAEPTLLVLAILLGLLSFVVQLPLSLMQGAPILATLYLVVLQFFTSVVGISVVTTLYGYYIEERRLG